MLIPKFSKLKKYGMLKLMFLYDFFFFYAAAQIIADSGNPYDFYQYSNYVESLGLKISSLRPFPYPAWSLGLIYPLAMAPFSISAFILGGISILLCSAIALKIVKSLKILNEVSAYNIYLLILSFAPLLKSLSFGQISWIVFIAIGGACLLAQKQRYFLAGAVLALASIKPHLAGPVILFALISNYLAKNKGSLTGFVVGMLILIGSSFLLLQVPTTEYISLLSFSPHKDSSEPIITSAPLGCIAQVIPQKLVNLTTLFLGTFVGISLARSIPFNTNSVFLVVTPLALILAPYSWSHDFLLLMPLALFGFNRLKVIYPNKPTLLYWIFWSLLSILTILESEWAFAILFLPFIPEAFKNYKQLYLPQGY
jgi:hypothetical protein